MQILKCRQWPPPTHLTTLAMGVAWVLFSGLVCEAGRHISHNTRRETPPSLQKNQLKKTKTLHANTEMSAQLPPSDPTIMAGRTLVEFRAGKCTQSGTTVTSDKRKGLISLIQARNRKHARWASFFGHQIDTPWNHIVAFAGQRQSYPLLLERQELWRGGRRARS